MASLEMRASRNGDVPAEVVSMLLTLASTVDEAVPEGTSTSVTTLMELVVVTFLMNRLLCIETQHTMGEGEMATTHSHSHSHSHSHTATQPQPHSYTATYAMSTPSNAATSVRYAERRESTKSSAVSVPCNTASNST